MEGLTPMFMAVIHLGSYQSVAHAPATLHVVAPTFIADDSGPKALL
jgi:hypothetical protein